jgi:hypothetical protein
MTLARRLLPLCLLPLLLPAADSTLAFNRDVRPILSENCFSCHGFDEKARKAKLRLDLPEEATREHKGGTPIVPGDLAKSEVWQRIISTDPDDVMPPPKSHLKLSAEDKATLKAWIQQGAKYESHWAFTAPKETPVPAPGHPIDAFVTATLKKKGLTPTAVADRATLIRRVTLDLTGLPPSAEEVQAFVADNDPQAYAKLVARLLASPHFGERMALEWLDSARYADTNGFSIDGGRNMWLWRDWVIQSFNDNLPYDQFVLQQLAGDLLPNATDAQLIATGFQRNNMNTHEGGTIPAENLVNYNADRVKTLGETMLGLTLGCAQCHDHKFDPISQKDYFQLFAYFNTLGDAGLDGNAGNNSGPSVSKKTVLKALDQATLPDRIAALKLKLTSPDQAALDRWVGEQQAALAKRQAGLKLYPINLLKISTPNSGGGFTVEGNTFKGLGGAAYDVLGETPKTAEPITGIRIAFTPNKSKPTKDPKDPKKVVSPAEKADFVVSAVDVTADKVAGDQVNIHKLQKFARVTASSWQPDFPAADVRAFHPRRGWSPDLQSDEAPHLTLTFDQPITADKQAFITTQVYFAMGGKTPAQGQLFAVTGTDDGTDLPADIIALIQTPTAQRTAPQQRQLWDYFAAKSKALEPVRTDLANAEQRLKSLTEPQPVMVMAVAAKPRETFILKRGDYSQPGEKVTAGTPAKLPPLPANAPANRLGLAQWMVMPENPLTARVAVNRFWKQLFGQGLVTTAADFGFQGAYPSHPELLDNLAVEFRRSGWDVKKLLTLIVTSDTYKRSSAPTAQLQEADPSNTWLARGPRFRLPAEVIRDAALKSSGLLVPQVGGPSVNPYSPFDLWREVSHYGSTPATAQIFVQDHGEKLYRRSLYTYWKRTAPPANMVAFDAPNREVCTVTRGNTTTPLQALVTLNDTQFVEASRALGERLAKRPGDDAAKLRWAFLEVLSREPSAQELAITTKALARERARYAANPTRAQSVLAVGEAPRDAALPANEHAAWMQVATLLLNLSEAVTRN